MASLRAPGSESQWRLSRTGRAAAAGSLLRASELGRGGCLKLKAPSGVNLAGHSLKSTVTSNIVTGHGQWQCLFSRTEHAYFGFIAAEHRNYNCFFLQMLFASKSHLNLRSPARQPSIPFFTPSNKNPGHAEWLKNAQDAFNNGEQNSQR